MRSALTPREMEAAASIVTRITGPMVAESKDALLKYAADSVVKLNREAHRAREGWARTVIERAKQRMTDGGYDATAVQDKLCEELEEIRGVPVDAAEVLKMLGVKPAPKEEETHG